MEAIVLTSRQRDLSGLEYRTIPIPEPRVGEAQIKAISINPYEYKSASGVSQYLRVVYPCTIGSDYCGTISALGEGCEDSGLSVGDQVLSYNFFGSWTLNTGVTRQYICVKCSRLVKKPVNLTPEQTACLPCAALTALTATNLARVSSGKTVIVVGSTGGVGCFVTSICQSRVGDAGKVVGVCSNAKSSYVRTIGATHVVDYSGDLDSQFAAILGPGGKADVLIDCYGNGSCQQYSRFIRTADPAAAIVTVADVHFRKPSEFACSFDFFICPYDDESSRAGLEEIVQLFEGGMLQALAEGLPAKTYDWGEYVDAHREIATGHTTGKLAIRVV